MTTEHEVLERIERARGRRPRLRNEHITMAHGAGGRATHTLIDAVFLPAFDNALLAPLEDQAVFAVGGQRLAFTTDSYVVSPLFFPGGTIGDLAVNGTANDLAVGGARPLYLSAAFVLEEGFAVADLRRIATSMASAARAAGVSLVTGDTKVVQRGKGDGCYVTTAGVSPKATMSEMVGSGSFSRRVFTPCACVCFSKASRSSSGPTWKPSRTHCAAPPRRSTTE